MKNIGKLALIPLLALMLNGDANTSNQNYRNLSRDKAGLTIEERETKETWEDLKKLSIGKYLGDTNIESLYSKGYLSKDYNSLQSNARREGNSPELSLLHSEAFAETGKYFDEFLQSNDLNAARRSLAAGYAAMLIEPNNPFNNNAVDWMKKVCSKLDSLESISE